MWSFRFPKNWHSFHWMSHISMAMTSFLIRVHIFVHPGKDSSRFQITTLFLLRSKLCEQIPSALQYLVNLRLQPEWLILAGWHRLSSQDNVKKGQWNFSENLIDWNRSSDSKEIVCKAWVTWRANVRKLNSLAIELRCGSRFLLVKNRCAEKSYFVCDIVSNLIRFFLWLPLTTVSSVCSGLGVSREAVNAYSLIGGK